MLWRARDRMKRLKGGHLPAWTQAEAELAMREFLEHLKRAVLLALFSGQRRGDLVRIPWSAYDGRTLRLRQGKTGAVLVIPVHPVMKVELDAWRARACHQLADLGRWGPPAQRIGPVSPDCRTQPSIGAW
jgi:integrase